MNKIKDILKDIPKNIAKLSLGRNPSNVSEIDFKSIFKNIISYFIDLKPECLYYYDLILFFYKNIINSKLMLKFILKQFPQIIVKLMNIIFNIDIKKNEDFQRKNINTKLIMIKLFAQILETIEESEVDSLYLTLNMYDKQILENENPFLYLYKKIINEINQNKLIV